MKQILIALDQLANTLIGGYADETISARAHRCGWQRTERVIDWLFLAVFNEFDHCRNAYTSELLRAHLPKGYRGRDA